MNIHQFKAKWQGSTLKERSAAQEHFIDLCRALGKPTPADVDPDGTRYTFERGVAKTGGGKGFADVWLRGHFAWEYKGQHADLVAAYQQLLQYREDLENPPLLVVCDLDRFEVHTNFTGTVKHVYRFSLEDIDDPEHLRVLRALFEDPRQLRPERTVETVTEEAAERFGHLALNLRDRGVEPHRTAHFLVQILFCLFAEDIGLLPRGLFSRLLTQSASHPDAFPEMTETMFTAMQNGSFFGPDKIAQFNGGLFAEIGVEPLTKDELAGLVEASRLDWASIEPAIIGTLFERSLDPDRRSQLGAHYTGRADIERVVDPVVLAPLRRRWDEVRAEADKIKQKWDEARTERTQRNRRGDFARVLQDFQQELTTVRVLDPACGSGNFLYIALNGLLDLEKDVITYGAANGLPLMFPQVRPSQLSGLEINQYAQELTQVVIWIGYLQWMTSNGFQPQRDPVLGAMETIRLQDALLDRSDPDQPREADWPAADYIIGNPPFLGDKRLRSELSDDYVEVLFAIYRTRVPGRADLVCYFFERARAEIATGNSKRAGLLATNSIRGGANRRVLERIKETGDIYMAWDDEPWILEGAAVRISIIGFDDGSEKQRSIDGIPATTINADLTAGIDPSKAQSLNENRGIAFIGDMKKAPFELPGESAREMLALPSNPNGRPNSDVVIRWANGRQITGRPQDLWLVDFGIDMPLEEAALYEAPFEHVRTHVYPHRIKHREARQVKYWWLHARPAPDMREALEPLTRYLATPRVAKHRLFVWLDGSILPDSAIVAIAREDDYFFGVLHSRAHEVWSLRMGTWLGKGNDPRYTPTTTFETFPFPEPTDEQREEIAIAAKRLNELRERWLNPVLSEANVPEGASEAELKKRTLTKLYNDRPTWLAQVHDRLDRAVWTAYGWDDPDPTATATATDDETILRRLLALNLERAETVNSSRA